MDPRIHKIVKTVVKDISANDTILIDSSLGKAMWKPDLLFRNEEIARRHVSLADQRMIEITPDGGMMLSEHITMKLRCIFHLKLFPFDTQLCPVTIQSYAFHDDQIRLHWTRGVKSKPTVM